MTKLFSIAFMIDGGICYFACVLSLNFIFCCWFFYFGWCVCFL